MSEPESLAGAVSAIRKHPLPLILFAVFGFLSSRLIFSEAEPLELRLFLVASLVLIAFINTVAIVQVAALDSTILKKTLEGSD